MKKAYMLVILLLIACTGMTQTYYSVTHFTGAMAIAGSGRTVTVVPTGHTSTPASCPAMPYWTGSTVGGWGAGTNTWTFDQPVYAVRMQVGVINLGDNATINVTTTTGTYCVTAANLSPFPFTCYSTMTSGMTGACTIDGVAGWTGQVQADFKDCDGIISVTIASPGGGAGVYNTFSFNPNKSPVFTGGSPQTLAVCANSAPVSINSLLEINDDNDMQNETWTLDAAPAHGVVVLGGPETSNGGNVTPAGCTYMPNPGFAGTDAFTISVRDCMGGTTTTVVNVAVEGPEITGNLNVCLGGTSLLAGIPVGGTWLSGNTTVATVSSSGMVTSVALGLSDITYTSPSGCRAVSTVTVIPSPAIYTLTSSASSYCAGGPGVTLSLSGSETGKEYKLLLDGVFTGTSLAGTGAPLNFGFHTGTGTYSVKATNLTTGCTSLMVGTPVISEVPAPTPIIGSPLICLGATQTLSDATPGGTWSSGDITVATIGLSSGDVTGLALGTSKITYTIAAGCTADMVVTVVAAPSPISGPVTVCEGQTITLTDAVSGGLWTSGDASVATIDPASGLVTGINHGTTTIQYRVASCMVYQTVTVNPSPSPIGGLLTICVGAVSPLTCTPASGTWTSSNTAVATIDPSTGLMSGVAVGASNITYTAPDGCWTVAVANVANAPAPISGPTHVCIGQTITLSDATAGGSWVSSDVSVADVDMYGVVTGMAAGAATISYRIGSCFATFGVTVDPLPGPITGPASTCVGASITLACTPAGGTWSSSLTGVATIGLTTGDLLGIGTGTTIASYELPSGCFTIRPIILNYTPEPITGMTNICVGQTTTLSCASPPGGTWTSPSVVVHLPDMHSGIVQGVFSGYSTVVYYVAPGGTGCSSSITVNVINVPPALSITGPGSVCSGHDISLSSGIGGGTWSSSNVSLATVTPSTGSVTGIASGPVNITYHHPTDACYSSSPVTVQTSPYPFPVTGGGSYCAGGTGVHVGLYIGIPGTDYQLYYGSTPVGAAVAGSAAPIDFGLQTAIGTYTVEATNPATGCTSGMTGSAEVFTVGTLPTSYVTYTPGTGHLCPGGSGVPIYLNSSQVGVDYQLYNGTTPVAGALLSGTGTTLTFPLQTAAGTYKVLATNTSSGCSTYMVGAPVLIIDGTYTVVGGGTYCVGGTGLPVYLDAGEAGISYQLYNGATAIGAPVVGTGVLIDFGPQTATGTYTVMATDLSAACSFPMVGHAVINLNALPLVHSVTGGGEVCSGSMAVGATIGLASSNLSINYELYRASTLVETIPGVSGGSISFSTVYDAGVYTVKAVNPYTTCTNDMSGSATVTRIGCKPGHTIDKEIDSTGIGIAFNVHPNPTSGSLNVEAQFAGTLYLYSLQGKELQKYEVSKGTTAIKLPDNLAAGVYLGKFADVKGNANIVRLVYRPN